jgi:hypothetical protein
VQLDHLVALGDVRADDGVVLQPAVGDHRALFATLRAP